MPSAGKALIFRSPPAGQQSLLAHEVRHDRPAGDKARGHGRDLQRGGQHRTLADAGDQGLALLPGDAGRRQLPVAVGDQPGAFAGYVEPERVAKTEAVSHRRDMIDAGAARGLVEIDVAGFLDRVVQMQRAVAALLPAMECRVAKLEIAGAGDRRIRGDRAAFERGQRDDRLEGRARRVEPADRLVG